MELQEALTQITEIRRQLARTQVFRGYRAVPVAFSGLLAFAAAGVQAIWIRDPEARISAYLALWLGAAILSAAAAGAGMIYRRRHPGSAAWEKSTTWPAVEQFLPSAAAGGLVTMVMASSAPESLWMLPGLWQVFFALGIFASCKLLPRATFGVGLYYLFTGLACLGLARGESAFSPWAMAVPFGVGQLLAAAVLYWNLERGEVEPD